MQKQRCDPASCAPGTATSVSAPIPSEAAALTKGWQAEKKGFLPIGQLSVSQVTFTPTLTFPSLHWRSLLPFSFYLLPIGQTARQSEEKAGPSERLRYNVAGSPFFCLFLPLVLG